jgi:hypothetical protein
MDNGAVLRVVARGKKFKIRHQTPGVQRYARESVMVFLGYALHTGEFQFSARPVAGTQHFMASHLLTIELVPDDTEIYLNHRAPKGGS